MTEPLEYIDAYFQNALNVEERKAFEEQCEHDVAFAKEVAFYITARQNVREELLANKQAVWENKNVAETKDNVRVLAPVKKMNRYRWLQYTASCIVITAGIYLFETGESAYMLAKNYVTKDQAHISLRMGSATDSLDLGEEAYNKKDYDRALFYFNSVVTMHPDNTDAKKYAGLAYLLKEDYDNALLMFTLLAETKGLASNPGDFYTATTLLLRNEKGDKEQAKQLLQKVVKEDEDGSRKAKEWLAKW